MISIYGVFVFSISFFVRFWVNRYRPINSDSYGHILFSKSLNPNNYFNFFGPINLNIIGSIPLFNPYLWNKLISFIPTSHLLQYNKHYNIFLDSIFITSIFIVLIKLDLLNIHNSLLTCLIYSISLINYSNISLGPRVSAFTPRLFTEILVNVYCIILVLKFQTYSVDILLVLSVLSYAIFCSSKFGSQFLILFSLLYSLLNTNFFQFLPTLIGFTICLIIHNRIFVKYIFYYYNFQKFYITNVIRKKTHVHNRNSFKDIFSFLNRNLHINQLIVWNSFIGLIYKFPYIFCIFPYLCSLNKNAFFFIISVLILFLLTSLKWFLSFGDAERYISHCSVAFLIISIQYIPESVIIGLLIISTLLILHEFRYIKKIHPNYHKLYKFLSSMKPSCLCLFPLYAGGGHWRVLLETKHKMLTPIPGACSSDILDSLNNNYLTYNPYYDLNKIDELNKVYGVDLFIIFKPELKLANQTEFIVPKNWNILNYNDPNFLILQK